MNRTRRILTASIVAAVLVLGTSACSMFAETTAPVATDKPPTGVDGAVNFDERYISAGTGAKKVDIWFDAMCPVCGVFEKANGDTFSSAVQDGSITVRLHPLTFLDRASNGTGYSTRAAAALTCVGVHDPSRVLAFYQSLFTDQPEENSQGLTDEELAALATNVGSSDISGCLDRSGAYQAWAQANTAHSQSGPIEVDGTKVLDTIAGTPTVLVDGKQYTGNISDAEAFRTFLNAS